MFDGSLLVRAGDGSWERLEPGGNLPDGDVRSLFGDDLAPVLGLDEPLIVVAAAPHAPGRPDAICVTPAGAVSVVALAIGEHAHPDEALPQLIAHAGAVAGHDLDAFTAHCTRVQEDGGSLADFVRARSGDTAFDAGAFESSLGEALATGNIGLVALVSEATTALVQSLKFLQLAAHTDVGCWQLRLFASSSVSAIQAMPVTDAQAQQATAAPAKPGASATSERPARGKQSAPKPTADLPVVADATPEPAARDAGKPATADDLFAATLEACDERTVKLMRQLAAFCDERFVTSYATLDDRVELRVALAAGKHRCELLAARSDAEIELSFASLAPVDGDWSSRAELVQGINRLLGADLGDVRKISQLNLQIREHLNDATLMEVFTDILADLQEQIGDQIAAAA